MKKEVRYTNRRSGCVKSFIELCEHTREKLERQLQEDEKEFLQWVYHRYQNEKRLAEHKDVYAETEEKLHC